MPLQQLFMVLEGANGVIIITQSGKRLQEESPMKVLLPVQSIYKDLDVF
jgi:hypothetical protein